MTLCAASNAAHAEICEDVAPTMLSRQYKDPPILVTDLFCAVDDNAKSAIDEDLCGTLKVGGGRSYVTYREDMSKYIVRRLLPVECERLMGLPDGHADLTGCDVDAVTERVAASLGYDEEQKAKLRRKVARWSKDCPDGPRYKAIGNSFATPVVRWIGERIQMVDEIIKEQEE